MQLAGKIMAGAQVSLLPPSIPYRFFIASGLFHIAAWALILIAADQVPGFQGGPGYVLAALHAMTLGVFAMTAIGASLQILPVVTGQSYRSFLPVHLMSGLFIPGVGILIAGFASGTDDAMMAGGVLVSAGLALYATLIVFLIGRAAGFRVLITHIRFAFLALVALIFLGLGMIFELLPGEFTLLAASHGSLALFGFMGLFAMGFSSILIPMFALANPAPEGRSLFIMAFYGAGLICGTAGILASHDKATVIGGGMLLMAAVSHALSMRSLLKKGMKKKLGLSFVLIRISWIFYPLGIALGVTAASGIPFDGAMLLAGYVAVFGWLLTFILGVQQQVMPFLAAMNVTKTGGAPPRLSQLAKGMHLKIHATCHFLAITLVGAGMLIDHEIAIQAGAAIGLVGAVAFLWFTLGVYRRMLTSGMPKNERPST